MIKSHFQSLQELITSQLDGLELRNQHSLIQIFESFGTQITERLYPLGQAPFYSNPRRPPVHPEVSKALQAVIRRKFEHFTSPEQAELINSVTSNRHILGILETGGGKSMAFFAAPKLCPGRLFVVISPTLSRMEDLRLRLMEHGIIGGVWKEEGVDANTAEILLVSAQHAGTDEFVSWISCYADNKRLMRIFVDKAHIIVDGSFSPCFKLLHRLTSVSVPITFLSAMLMPRSIPYLLHQMQIRDLSTVDEIRHYTGRKNLKYWIEKVDNRTMLLPRIQTLLTKRQMRLLEKERGIIFCDTTSAMHALSELSRSPLYQGDLNKESRDKAVHTWVQGKSYGDRWLLCIHGQAFGEDLYSPLYSANVHFTVHLNPQNFIHWVHETGQAGRNNTPATCYTFWSTLPCALPPSDPDHSGRREMQRLLPSADCIRLGFNALDREAWSCTELDGELCSNCEKAAQVSLIIYQSLFC